MKNLIKIFATISMFSMIVSLQACGGNNHKMNNKTDDTHTMMQSSQMGDSMSNNYACPMHKNVIGKKGDKCSECGMDMKEMNYSCPMHKNMMGMKGDKCSECGMDLTPMNDEDHEGHNH
jgi:hypothetical protein